MAKSLRISSTRPLLCYRILVVEDSAVIAGKLSRVLGGAGVEVVGPVATVGAALDAISKAGWLDAALLDIDLRGERVYPVAEILTRRRVPFLFLTGYDSAALPEPWCDWPLVQKPFTSQAMLGAVARLLESGPAAAQAATSEREVHPDDSRIADAVKTSRNLIMERHILRGSLEELPQGRERQQG